jgi:hypothetical protein
MFRSKILRRKKANKTHKEENNNIILSADAVIKMTGFLQDSELPSLAASCHFFNRTLKQSAQFFHRQERIKLKYNIKNFNCNRKIFKSYGQKTNNILVYEDLLLTSSVESISAWNKNTGKRLWSLFGEFVDGNLSVVDGKVVYLGKITLKDMDASATTHCITLDIKTGILLPDQIPITSFGNNPADTKVTASTLALSTYRTKYILAHDQIITKSYNTIYCWDLTCQLVEKYITTPEVDHNQEIYANEQYIAEYNNSKVYIITRATGIVVELNLEREIDYSFMVDHLLVCVVNLLCNQIIIIDMTEGKIRLTYKPKKDELNSGIESVVATKDKLCVSFSPSARVNVINLLNNQISSVKYPLSYTPVLSVKDNYLFVDCQPMFGEGHFLSIWDLETLTNLRNYEMDNITAIQWDNGALFLATQNPCSLVKYDYKVLHQKGEVLENKPVPQCSLM